jgi:DNA-directed RNA polymerase subunit H (RpoH/RPB5)
VKGKENFLVKYKEIVENEEVLQKERKKRLLRTVRIQIWKQTKDVH